MKKAYSLALGWWAARWLVHVWVLKYLEENDIKIKELSWTSMWAIIAAMIAMQKTSSDIIEFVNDMNYLKLIDVDFKTWLLKWNKIEKKLEELFWDTNIEDTNIPLKIVATNIETSVSNIFETWRIVDAIRASISLPWVFIPKVINSQSYCDGWIMMNLPIEILSWDYIIAVSALKINKWPIEKTKKVFWISFKNWFFKNNYEIIKRSVILMMKVNEDVSLKNSKKDIILIRPDFWKLDLMDFNKIDEFIEIWYNEINKYFDIKDTLKKG